MKDRRVAAYAVGRRPRDPESGGRERLLDAAVRLFSERGIANTTVAQVARAGQVTSAMVHYWFSTRDLLLDAVVEERLLPHIRHIWDDFAPAGESAAAVIGDLVKRLFEVGDRAPWLPSLWLREIIQEGGLLRARVHRKIPREPNELFRECIAQAQRRGELRPGILVELLFLTMLALVMLLQAARHGSGTGTMGRGILPDKPIDRQLLERHVLTVLLTGVSIDVPPGRGSDDATGA